MSMMNQPRVPSPSASVRSAHWRPTLIALVFLGGMAGTLSRALLNGVLPAPLDLPLPTLIINLSGSFALGLLLESLLRTGADRGARLNLRVLLGTGFLGGFTTYSAFALETVELVTTGSYGFAAAYVMVSVLGGILFSFAGIGLATVLTRRKAQPQPTSGKGNRP